MEISVDTLDGRLKEEGYANFSDYFKKYSAAGKASLRRMQYAAAEKGSVGMMVWLGKQYLGQRDKSDLDSTLSGKDGKAPVFKITMTKAGKFKEVRPRAEVE